MSTKKIIAYSAIGIVSVVVFAAWFPAGAFYFFFQREILSHDRQSGLGGVLWARPTGIAEAASRTGSSPAPSGGTMSKSSQVSGKPWRQILHGDFLLPLPPGKLRRVATEGDSLVIEFEEGVLTVDRFQRGFLRDLFAREYERVNGDRRDISGMEDAESLEAAAFTTPGDFRFSMNGRTRTRYAVSLLVKMLLWDCPSGDLFSEKDSKLFHMEAFRLEGGRSGALLAGPGFGTRVLVVTPQGVFAYAARGACPDEWSQVPARWGEVLAASGEAARLWSDMVRTQYPEGDPLRNWAEARGAKTPPASSPTQAEAAPAVPRGVPAPSAPTAAPKPPAPAPVSPGSFVPAPPSVPGFPRPPGR